MKKPHIKTYTTVFIDKLTKKEFILTTCLKLPKIKLDITSASHPAFNHKTAAIAAQSKTKQLLKKIGI
ncbi:50S ribosomal protein L31 [Candidatus Vidania fulgoroideae]|nr:50S ribosomal protein L31 [Candidatus Vidania fulgoroideae]